jgi:hypothetical protein
MPNGTAHRDLEWLKRILRKHFRHSWRQIAAKLEARQAEVMPMDARARTVER